MNLNGGRRARSCNFTPEETEKLVSLVAEYRNVIENKTKDAATWQAKQNAWVALMTEYNKSGGTFRDLVHVKMKYEALKRDARKKCQILEERKQAGERIDKAMLLTPLEKKVLNMAMPTEGGETSNDFEQPVESIVELASKGDETSNDSEQPDSNNVSEVAENPAKRIKVEKEEEEDLLASSSEQVDQNIADSSNEDAECDPQEQASGQSEEHTATYSNNVSKEVAENPAKRIKVELEEEEDLLASTSEQVDQNIAESANEDAECDPQEQASGQSEEHTATSEPIEQNPIDILSDEKLETSVLQKTILQEELKEKRLKRRMMEDEMKHKNELHMLAKTEMLLKIEILKTELEKKKM